MVPLGFGSGAIIWTQSCLLPILELPHLIPNLTRQCASQASSVCAIRFRLKQTPLSIQPCVDGDEPIAGPSSVPREAMESDQGSESESEHSSGSDEESEYNVSEDEQDQIQLQPAENDIEGDFECVDSLYESDRFSTRTRISSHSVALLIQ